MRTFRIFFNTIKTLSLKKIMRLLSLVLPHPIFSLLSFYATAQAFTIAQKKFPKTASNNGIGNAFRHALWTCFIMMYCCKVSSPRKALNFCKRITDMHEDLFPNKPLETKMDLHNNKIGMDYFMELLPGIHRQFFEKGFFIDALEKKMADAKVLKNPDDNFEGFLVYLDEK
ncbi:hypothetical protein ATE47_16750 [Chryseobacterium sp. IHB B 17019]|jgi:hypothetical protein|uniref:DUF6973 domain-containing protein n=1 Tax=Chryseobacterium sp. IHB B 17019 TaxID=1721091 RepID=UPI0007223AE7|nr:hypothetical protein [Chryseobacterium sp. IHB B 17019]ALR32066.1 hypothetical protein ATE47_16750 [Chryseobacterium sp. IHB B 17019]